MTGQGALRRVFGPALTHVIEESRRETDGARRERVWNLQREAVLKYNVQALQGPEVFENNRGVRHTEVFSLRGPRFWIEPVTWSEFNSSVFLCLAVHSSDELPVSSASQP